MSQSDYYASVDAARIQHIRQICRELPQACSDFLSAIATTTGTFTRLAYAIDLKTFFHFLETERVAFSQKQLRLMNDQDLASLTQMDLVAYSEYLTYYLQPEEASETNDLNVRQRAKVNHELSIKRKLCAVRSFYDFLFKSNRIEANVTTLVALPKIHEKPIIRLDQTELERILMIAETGEGLTEQQLRFHEKTVKRDYAMLMLFLGTGIRVSECVGIDIGDIDFSDNAFLVTRKGGDQMVLYFPEAVADALKDYLVERKQIQALPGHEEALFLSLQKRRITQRAVQQLVKKYGMLAAPLKPKISPHKLRSTYATNLYQATGDIYLVADVLGHADVNTTRRHYAAMLDDRRRMAAKSVKLRSNPAKNDEET